MTIMPCSNLKYEQPEVTSVDVEGDATLCVGNPVSLRLLVSSNRLAASSSVFAEMLAGPKPMELDLSDDPDTMHLICKSVHGLRLTQSLISIDVLLKLTAAIKKYKFSRRSNIYQEAVLRFHNQILYIIEASDLCKLIEIAGNLGPPSRRSTLIRHAILHRRGHLGFTRVEGIEESNLLLGRFPTLLLQKSNIISSNYIMENSGNSFTDCCYSI